MIEESHRTLIRGLAKTLRGNVDFAYMPDRMANKHGIRIDPAKDNALYLKASEGSKLSDEEIRGLVANHFQEHHPRAVSISVRPSTMEPNHSQVLQIEPDFKPHMKSKFLKVMSTSRDGDTLLKLLADALNE